MGTPIDVGAVAAGARSVAQGLKGANAQVSWPNAHEAIMELFVITDDWCEAARNSNRAAQRRVEARIAGFDTDDVDSYDPLSNIAYRSVGPITLSDFIAQTQKDVRDVMSPPAPWVQRWRRSKRRSAGRRTLHSMLHIYEPDLLDAFEAAVGDRAEWVKQHRENFEDLFGRDRPIEELLETLARMDETLTALIDVRERLLTLIREKYPLGPPVETMR